MYVTHLVYLKMVQNLLWGTEEHLIRGLNIIMLVLFNVIFYTNNKFLQYMCVKKTSFASEKNILIDIILSDFKEKLSYIIIINY